MSEAANVRLVRCPKCENLLPELADYSFYQCGGCGAILRGNSRSIEVDNLSQRSDEERVTGISENFPEKSVNFKFSERRKNMSDGSETDVKSNTSSSRRTDNRKFLTHVAEHKRNYSSMKADKWVVDNDHDTNQNLNPSSLAETGKEFEHLKPPIGIANSSRRSGRVADWTSREEGEVEGFWRNSRRDFEGVNSSSMYSEEGPSNYHLMSGYGYGEPMKNQNKLDESNQVEPHEPDRAELLRKFDELKDQLSQFCDVNDKSKEKVPLNWRLVREEEPYGGFENRSFGNSWASTRASSQSSMPDAYYGRPHFAGHYPEPSPYTNRHQTGMNNFYPSMHTPNQVQRFRTFNALQQQQLYHPKFSGQYIGDNFDPHEPYPPNLSLHHPSCSCFQCYNKHPKVPAPLPPTGFCGKSFSDLPNNPMFYHHENPNMFDQGVYNPKTANPLPLNSWNPQSHRRWPSDLTSEVGSFVRHRPPPRLATSGRHCRPIAGGAPFLTCYNCFELLLLPKKIFRTKKNQKTVKCGACSISIVLEVGNKDLHVSVHAKTKNPSKMVDDGLNVISTGGTSHQCLRADHGSTNFSSEDFDNSGYVFQSMDRENKSEEMKSLNSTSHYNSSEEKGSPQSLNVRGEESSPTELAAKANPSPPPAGSPLQEYFDYSNKYHAANQVVKGNQSGRSEREKEEPKKATSRQNSMKDASLATEMEVSSHEYSNTGTSLESGEASREEDRRRVKKGGSQSFFTGIIKKSFRDTSRSDLTFEESSTNVMVNGHPIPDRLLKKAEKLAGPVHPGEYWYDFRAGFWGVTGGPCLGIIPPFIEEFNFPMPEKCGGGNTGVFVNGRELNQRDFDLLCGRGLPSSRDRSYVIEISGRVLDVDTGEELDSLGKLAPTVEKVKHGFGMKVPRVAAKK